MVLRPSDNGVGRINKVVLRRARLVLRRVTVQWYRPNWYT